MRVSDNAESVSFLVHGQAHIISDRDGRPAIDLLCSRQGLHLIGQYIFNRSVNFTGSRHELMIMVTVVANSALL